MTVSVTSFGCRLNGVESDRMAALATAAGHRDLAIVNTCAVTAEAVRQGRQAIRRLKRERPDRGIMVTGCAAEIEPVAFAAMPEVDRRLPNAGKATPAAWGLPDTALDGAPPPSAHTRGFVEIQNGCDHRCTFCVIPFGRGASRSIPPEGVIARAGALMEAGAREIVLTGVDITAYGADRPGLPRLGGLVRALLAALPALPRLRLSSIDCIEADRALLEAIATEPRLMPHWHLSLQSGSDVVLKRMRRRHGRADALRICAAIRAARPEAVFGADFIAGFPTETEAMAADTLDLVEACGITHLHVFPFSPRPGTPAARMPPVDPAIVRQRAARLRAAGEGALRRHLAAQAGRTLPVLMERGGRGRTPDFTAVRLRQPVAAGDMTAVRIEGDDGRELHGSLAGLGARQG